MGAAQAIYANETLSTLLSALGRPAVQLKRSNSTVSSAGLYAKERRLSTASAKTPLYVTVTPSISSARRNKRQGQFADREAAGTGCFIPHNDCPGTQSYDTCKGECKPDEPGKPVPSPNQTQCPKCLSKGAIAGIAIGTYVDGALTAGVAVSCCAAGALASAFRR